MSVEYTGWDRWLYPIRLEGAELKWDEDSGASETFTFQGTFYATREAHGSTLPGTGFYDALETKLANSGLANDYLVSATTLPEHAPSSSTIQIERTSGSTGWTVQPATNGVPLRGLLGWRPTTFSRSSSNGVLSAIASNLGALMLPADRAADQRGWPRRRAGRSRPDIVRGRIREHARWRHRNVVYRPLASVDVHPSRVEDTVQNPLYASGDFDDSAFFDEPLYDPNNQIRQLFRRGAPAEDVIVVWGDGDAGLNVTSHTWEVGTPVFPGRWREMLQDWERGERYRVRWQYARDDGNRVH